MVNLPGGNGIAMKRNMVPLFGIAVVVATISTGVIYGLFAGKLRSASAEIPGQPIIIAARDLERGAVLQPADVQVSQFKGTLAGSFANADQVAGATLLVAVKRNEPLIEERLMLKAPKTGDSNGAVPQGLRAVSIRVSDSESLIGMLRPGARVDLQAIRERNGALELRTILQNVEVLAANPQVQPGGGNRGPVSIVTVLTRPQDADLVALADSAARIRLTLRNPLDDKLGPRPALAPGSIFQSPGSVSQSNLSLESPQVEPPTSPGPGLDSRAIQLHIQVLNATAAAAQTLQSKLARGASGDSLDVASFRSGAEGTELVGNLEKQHQLEIVLDKSLTARPGRSAKFQAGSASCQLRMQFSTRFESGGKINLRVRPEISSQLPEGVQTQVYEAELPATGSFLVTGILDAPRDREFLTRLFPRQSWGDHNLAILVTSQESSSREVPALAQSRRGR
jgi:Flp pilus assembly protein CpaB